MCNIIFVNFSQLLIKLCLFICLSSLVYLFLYCLSLQSCLSSFLLEPDKVEHFISESKVSLLFRRTALKTSNNSSNYLCWIQFCKKCQMFQNKFQVLNFTKTGRKLTCFYQMFRFLWTKQQLTSCAFPQICLFSNINSWI